GSDLLRGTLDRQRAPRPSRPHPRLEPLPTRATPTRICRALPHPPAPPEPRPTRTRHSRNRRVPAWPTDPTTRQLRRAHQRVPPSRLNHPDNGQPLTNGPPSPRRAPPPIWKQTNDAAHRPPNAFPAPTRLSSSVSMLIHALGRPHRHSDPARGPARRAHHPGSRRSRRTPAGSRPGRGGP